MPPLHVRVTGLVQGVGFRWFVREASHALGLAGWVRNRPDGSVEVAVDGPPDALHRLATALQEGPPGARIDQVERLSADAIEPPITTAFRVVR